MGGRREGRRGRRDGEGGEIEPPDFLTSLRLWTMHGQMDVATCDPPG